MELNLPDTKKLLLNRISYIQNKTKILDSVSIPISMPSIHLVIGEHGAGKTSLANIICGYSSPYEGNIIFDNKIITKIERKTMQSIGIYGVINEPAQINSLRVVDNFYLPSDSKSLIPKIISQKTRMKQLLSFFNKYDIDISPGERIELLGGLDRMKIELLKTVYHSKSVIVLDNFFEKLATSQYDSFLKIIKNAAAQGKAVVIFTEKLDDLYDIADYISILRDGKILITERTDNISRFHILRLTYAQLSKYNPIVAAKKNFTHLLKYNEAILNYLPINLIVTGLDKRIEIINKCAELHFNIDSQKYYDQSIDELFGTNNDKIVELLNEALNDQNAQNYVDVPILFGENMTLNIIKTFPIIDGSVSIGCMIIIEDITKQTRIRNQLNLSERLASVGLLAAGVAHEINTPLGTMLNYIDTIRMENQNLSIENKLFEIDNQISYISGIIENLMLFANSDKGITKIFDLNDSIRELTRFLKKSILEKNILIELKLSESKLTISGFEAEFKQVIMNLIKNSIESIESDGKITIISDRRIINGESVLEIVVLDTGKGIDSEMSEKIFYPFFSTKKGGKNFGLGLFVSHQIIESMKGKLLIYSPDKGGCAITIQIPNDSL